MALMLLDLVTYLATQGVGVAATTLFYGIVPPTPDAMVTLMEYGGLANEPDMGTPDTRLVFPSVQVIARGVKDDYDGPRQKAQDVVTAFAKVVNTTLSGTRYLAIAAKQDPFFLRRDDNFRVEIAVNFQITKNYTA